MAMLLAKNEGFFGRTYPIREPVCILGRRPDCDISDPFAGNEGVSRQHAKITKVQRQFSITDLDSRNGTSVNGAKINDLTPLADGDHISIFDVTLVFSRTAKPTAFGIDAENLTRFGGTDDDSSVASSISLTSPNVAGDLPDASVANARLQAIFDMLGSLGSSLSLLDVLENLLTVLFQIFGQAERGFIGLRRDGDSVIPTAVKYRRPGKKESVVVSRTIVSRVLTTREAVLCTDASLIEAFSLGDSVGGLRNRSIMCTPLLDSEGDAVGVLQLDSVDSRHPFDQRDLEMLAATSRLAALALEFARVHERELQQKMTEVDLATAHRLQLNLLPNESPQLSGYNFFAFYDPARQVGGDYYDYVPLADGRMAVLLADATGKGVAAAIMMSMLSGELKYWLGRESSPAEVLNRVNRRLLATDSEGRFVTLVLAALDPQSHQVTIANAGHFAPLLRRADSEVVSAEAASPQFPLGIDWDEQYCEFSIGLEPGDCLTLFSDGITDAMDGSESQYGLPRLRQTIAACRESAEGLGDQIITDVRRFAGQRPQVDDMCLMCFGRP